VPKTTIFTDFFFRFCSYCPEHTRRALIARQIVGFAPPMSPASTSTSKTLPTPTPMPTPTPTPQSRKRRAGSTSSAQIQAAVAAATAPPSHASAHKYIKDLAHYEGIGAVVKKESEGAHSSPKKQKNDCNVFGEMKRLFKSSFFDADSKVYMPTFAVTVTRYRGTCELCFQFN
jgi:hypothetical protein